MVKFLSCDWGTSSFRLRLVNAADLTIIAAEHSGKGIAATFHAWQKSGQTAPEARLRYYRRVILEHIQAMAQQLGTPLVQAPLIISGMASSSIGMAELPYHTLPFSVDGAGIGARHIPADASFPHDILLISGIRSNDDVMRGEETQLVGCMAGTGGPSLSGTVIFPGTHSKHITVKDRQAVAFSTFMTGEFFALLTEHSILKSAVRKGAELSEPSTTGPFSQGVQDAGRFNLLHATFRIRARHLFGALTPEENLDYLSGLLIGAELQELLKNEAGDIYLCGAHLQDRYAMALQVLGLEQRLAAIPAQRIEEAAVRGQYAIFNQLKQTHAS